jgi:RNA polymerase sigma-70 factor (ECF subfamily)
MEEKSYKEVCVHSGYELKKVKSYIQNGRRNLKSCIEKA